MKKIAIVTLNGYFNYGNRLQNYALQETIKDLGFSVETIINEDANHSEIALKDRMKNLTSFPIAEIYNKIKIKILLEMNNKELTKSKEIRTKIFKEFTHDCINETSYTISQKKIPQHLSDKYDYFITGSDQVWNPNYNYGSPINFLTFAEKKKRIAYSPSFGVSEIETEYIKNYKKWISGIYKLSVREDDGARIIKELTGREAPVLVDPTLLLTKEKWLSISKTANNKPKVKYLLTYFLGGIPKVHKQQIDNISKKYDLETINLGDIEEKETYRTGPREFIDYINSCSVFCTDSFHGVAFSILMKKPFIVYDRMGGSLSMFSRINTLLEIFNLNSRKNGNLDINEDVFDIDYSNVSYILEIEHKKAMDYLKDALDILE